MHLKRFLKRSIAAERERQLTYWLIAVAFDDEE